MPNKDWTGPCWKGPKTWRWKWCCGSKNLQNSENLENDETEQSEQWIWKWKGRCCGK